MILFPSPPILLSITGRWHSTCLVASMRILVTGGTGVVGTGTVTELLRRGHAVVLVSRHADDDARQWPAGVVARSSDVTDGARLRGTAEGCDAVLHMAGIVAEGPPDVTFATINVEGTKHILAEAERAGVKRFVFVSSLGAPRGESGYHRSKREAEAAVRSFRGAWTICRPGNVYGPGDEQISVLLRMVRGASPIIPKIGDGDQPFQPIWWEDAAYALADLVERDDLSQQCHRPWRNEWPYRNARHRAHTTRCRTTRAVRFAAGAAHQ